MNLRRFFPLAVALIYSGALQAEETAKLQNASEGPSLTTKILKPWTFFKGQPKEQGTTWKQLELSVKLDPLPLSLSESRQLKVTLRLLNKSKRLLQLEFPTTQRIEVLIRNSTGKVIERWSEDQSFANELTLVAVNPGERLEYTVSVSTRDMTAGQSYTLESFFPTYDHLRASTIIIPEK